MVFWISKWKSGFESSVYIEMVLNLRWDYSVKSIGKKIRGCQSNILGIQLHVKNGRETGIISYWY
jgi:hypothetical protein